METVAGVTPVPLRFTGELVTATLAVMVNIPVKVPSAFGWNTTLMVQVPVPGVRVVPQVPPAVPLGREKRAEEKKAAADKNAKK